MEIDIELLSLMIVGFDNENMMRTLHLHVKNHYYLNEDH